MQHALVSIALLQTGRCDEDGIVASLPVSGRHIAWANLICSMISICFGLVSKTMQQLILSSDPRASSLARSLLDSANSQGGSFSSTNLSRTPKVEVPLPPNLAH